MEAKNLRMQKQRDAWTKKLYNWRYWTVSLIKFLFGGFFTKISQITLDN